jgi:putative SOS response-associated peptidase YedK
MVQFGTMCGRYTLIRLADFTDMFPWIRAPEQDPPPRYNIAPTQAIAVVPNDGNNRIDFFRWGLIPSWAKDPAIGNRMVNARVESLAEKPAFRTALKRRRCLIPASGFYEWRKNPDKTKTPMYIRLKNGKPFSFAGLWEIWHSDDGSQVRSCTIITGPANELIRNIHDRMPVILDGETARKWIEPEEVKSDKLLPLLKPFPADKMQADAVSRAVNNPSHDAPDCIESITDEAPVAGRAPAKRLTRSRRKSDDSPRLFG